MKLYKYSIIIVLYRQYYNNNYSTACDIISYANRKAQPARSYNRILFVHYIMCLLLSLLWIRINNAICDDIDNYACYIILHFFWSEKQ